MERWGSKAVGPEKQASTSAEGIAVEHEVVDPSGALDRVRDHAGNFEVKLIEDESLSTVPALIASPYHSGTCTVLLPLARARG